MPLCFFQLSALGIGRNDTATEEENSPIKSHCGVNFCPWTLETTNETSIPEDSKDVSENFKTTDVQIYTLAGIYLACSLIGPIIIAIFVDPLSR